MTRNPERPRARLGTLLRYHYRAAGGVTLCFVVAELAQSYLSAHLGWALGGVLAGLVLFTMSPLQVAAERRLGTGRSTQQLDRLSSRQRTALFQEQARLAWQDGDLTAKERLILDNLRERLGLSPEQASRLESEVVRGPN